MLRPLRMATLALQACLPVCLTACLTACLPDRQSAASLLAAVDAAQADSAAASVPATCGNNKVDPPAETCDTGSLCQGCEGCQRRRVWSVASDKALVALDADGTGKLLADAAKGLSLEFWFKPAVQTAALPMPVLLLFKNSSSPALAMTLERNLKTGKTHLSCAYRQVASDVKANLEVVAVSEATVGTWQHGRCLWRSSGQLELQVNGNKESVASPATALSPSGLFAAGTLLWWGGYRLTPQAKVFEGQLDELRVMTGDGLAMTAPFRRRHEPNAATQLLIHADEADGSATLADASGAKRSLLQTERKADGSLQFGKATLEFADDACYGYTVDAAVCKAAAPFCP